MEWLRHLFTKRKTNPLKQPAQMFFTNTLSGKKELFIPQRPGIVSMYTCGPTVYGKAHIGNLRAYIFSDTIARTLSAAGYHLRRVINITDFGHLVSDNDEGEDKMTEGLRREGLSLTLQNMRAMAEKYTALFIDDLEQMNVDTEEITFPRASDYIPEQIALISTLEQKGYAYHTNDGVYFDTRRFPTYGQLGGIDLEAQQVGTRVKQNLEKHRPADFVLWKPDPSMGWESPWGFGFPGWHIECSAMSRALLGQELDIHTGGEDHVAVHHNNEIAQSEAASGRTFVHYWMHNAFLNMGGEKSSKSLGNVVYLSDVIAKGFHPLALRYFFLQAQYRTPLSFSWDSIASASSALERLERVAHDVVEESKRKSTPSDAQRLFLSAMRDDLATPQALAILWDTLRNEDYTPAEKLCVLEEAEVHFGIPLTKETLITKLQDVDIPKNISSLLARREKARKVKDFKEADRIREEIENSGYHVDDGLEGPMLTTSSF